MPLKHTEPQQNPQHSTETAKSGYAVTHTRGISESIDLPADAITASATETETLTLEPRDGETQTTKEGSKE